MKIVLIEAVLMDNDELISGGKSLGFVSQFAKGMRDGKPPVYERGTHELTRIETGA